MATDIPLLAAAVEVEARKTASSRVSISILSILVLGVALLSGSFAAAVASGNVAAIAKLGPTAARPGWPGLVSSSTQIAAAASLLALATLLSWMVGREFSEGTITGLFALPVGRASIVLAKLAVHLVATLIAAVAIPVVLLGLGAILGFGWPAPDDVAGFARLTTLIVLSGLLASPVAWVATVGRGLLPGIGLAVGLVVSAQVAVVADAGSWFPIAAPALWAIDPGTVPVASFAGVLLLWLVFVGLTLRSWSALQLDR
jgi:ABC-2 type transport system permease protein